MRTNGKITNKMSGVSRLIIINATTIWNDCDIAIRVLIIIDMSEVSISLENLLSIRPIGVVSDIKVFLIQNMN